MIARLNRERTAWFEQTIARARSAHLERITVDEQGRPIVAVRYEEPVDIAGLTLVPPPGASSGRALIRLTSDAARLDRAFVLRGDPAKDCDGSSIGHLSQLFAGAGRIAFVVEPESGCSPTRSTLRVLDAP